MIAAYVQTGYGIIVIIPFPVCAYAAIHYKNGRRLVLVVFLSWIAAYAQTGNGIMTIIPFPVCTSATIHYKN